MYATPPSLPNSITSFSEHLYYIYSPYNPFPSQQNHNVSPPDRRSTKPHGREIRKLPRQIRRMRFITPIHHDPLDNIQTWFFYGNLMYPLKLQSILKLSSVPVLWAARVWAKRMKMWGAYPVLLTTSDSKDVVVGMVLRLGRVRIERGYGGGWRRLRRG